MDGNFYQPELLDEIDRASGLPVRARIPFHMKDFMKLSALDKPSEMQARYRSERLRSGFVKMFMDGVIDSGTAFMEGGYADPEVRNGEPLFPAEQFGEIAIEADRRGLQIAVHAIGDGAGNVGRYRRALRGYRSRGAGGDRQAASARHDLRRADHI
jgi:predicted amidohydrolase YtcJ